MPVLVEVDGVAKKHTQDPNLLQTLNEYVDRGLLSVSIWKNDLLLYNYTRTAEYDSAWDEITLNSRATLVDKKKGKRICYSFPKFFNLNQHETTKEANLPNEPFEVFEKVDGSLLVITPWRGELIVTTRGSFYSPQATFAKKLIDKKYPFLFKCLREGECILAEVIYPENRIIVDYGDMEDIVVLAWAKPADDATDDFVELSYDTVIDACNQLGLKCAKKHKMDKLEDVVSHVSKLDWQDEGLVVRYWSGLRVKVKSSEYLRIAKVKQHLSPKYVWEAMRDSVYENYIKGLPDELFDDVKAMYATLLHERNSWTKNFLMIRNSANQVFTEKKDYALWVKSNPELYWGGLFCMYDLNDINEKKLEHIVYSIIKPRNTEE